MADLNDRVDDLEDRLNGVLSVAQNALHEISNLSVIVIGNREEQLLCRADDRIASRLKTSVQIELAKYQYFTMHPQLAVSET